MSGSDSDFENEDLDFIQQNNFSFLLNKNLDVEENYLKKKAKKVSEQKDEEETTTYLLPIKTDDGKIVVPTVKKEENLSKKEIEKREILAKETVKEEKKEKPKKEKRKREDQPLKQKRPKKDTKITQIADISTKILENPISNISKLSQLLDITQDQNIQIQKLALLSLLSLFLDLIPDYRISLDQHDEKIQHKKEIEESHKFEKSLLANYQKYLQILSIKKDSLYLSFVAIKCLCELLEKKQHFNFRYNIIESLIPHLNSSDEKSTEAIFNAITNIFQNDLTKAYISLEIVQVICNFILKRKYIVSEQVTNVFLFLKLSTPMDDDQKNDEFEKNQTEILNQIIVSYLRLLKTNHQSPLLFSILSGLSKFSHLINIELLHDLMSYMKIILEMGDLPVDTYLQTLITSSKLRLGLGMALNIDFGEYYTLLYKAIPLVCEKNDEKHFRLLVDALYLMLFKFKLPKLRVAAFVKRILTWSLYVPHYVSIVLVHIAKLLMSKYPAVHNEMIAGEESGIGEYSPEIDHPDHSNPLSTNLWEYAPLLDYFDMKSILENEIKELSSEEYQDILSTFQDIRFKKNHNVKNAKRKFKTPFLKKGLKIMKKKSELSFE